MGSRNPFASVSLRAFSKIMKMLMLKRIPVGSDSFHECFPTNWM
jgi:hypothetical protein